ncbi:AraC family transcriptional regulator [Mucilaginibacter sp. BJC16-A38]|uniref:helix-turn-helix domain-containing protein n=1 Tax=Mucilaginibacter phenanthrenivorans TaxID=1234842 RepID=UPI002157159C|nr:helix-turn-helix domain-containing protein [Mucilaginibacter phenanthrenivorans]MCR8561675.1 AraC family transcriptional regulator [Mucilaginibacter phenanthrenivorans]
MLQSTPVYDICTLSDFRSDEILISRFAPYLEHHKNLHAAHRHTFYHVVFFTDGAGSHTIDFENFPVRPNQIYFMIPGQVHSWSFEGFVDGYIINFSNSFFQSFLLNAGYCDDFSFFSGDVSDAVIDLPEGLHQKIKSLFEDIIKEWETPQVQNADMLRLLMLQLFISVNRFSAGGSNKTPASYNQTLLKNFQKLIEIHYKSLKLPKDYATLLYITPNHLNALCKDLLGMQAGEVIRNRSILEAKRLLTNPQLTITEIAYELNFSDNSYFTKFFKKTEGVTPEEFRKNILNQNQS